MSFSWGRANEVVEHGSLGITSRGNSGPLPQQGFPQIPPYPLYAVLEPQFSPDGLLLLEQLLQRLCQRWRRRDLQHRTAGSESGLPNPRHSHSTGCQGLGGGIGATPPELTGHVLSRLVAKDNVLPVLRPQQGARQLGKMCPVPRDELSPQNQSLNHPTRCTGSL